MKKYLIILVFITFLFSCSKENSNKKNIQNENTKIPFYIETKEFSWFSNEILFKKSAKLVSTSQIDVSSQASWKISKINFKVWDKVFAWQNLVILEDNISNYYTSIERAQNALERAKINYDSTLLALDKSISDASLNYEKLKKSHELLILDSQEKLQKLKKDFGDADITLEDSKAKLDYKKAKLDYENSLISDQNQIKSFIENTKTTHKNLSLTYFDLINYLDEIFWVTDKNRYRNDNYEIYLWAKNSSYKTEAENKLRILISKYDDFKNKDLSQINEENLIENIEYIEKYYLDLKDIVDISKEVLINSVESTSLPKATIDSYFSKISTYWSSISSSYTSFISLKTSIISFLDSYKNSQKSREEQLSILEKQLNINSQTLQSSLNRTKIEIENSILNSQNLLKTAKNNLDNAIKNKEITLRSLQNTIKEAEITLSESRKNAWKLIIKSPISWIISKKLIDVWQEVTPGIKLFSIVWDNSTKVEIYLSKDEKQLVSVWDKVKINYFNNELSGKIESISTIASSDFTYLTTINLLDKVEIIWDFVEVEFLSKAENVLLPISILKIIWNNKALVNLFKDGKIVSLEIEIWQIYGNEVEVLGWLEFEDEIILTDLKNYNENRFYLIKK